MHLAALTCEFGMVTVSLLNVLSNSQHPDLRTTKDTDIRMAIVLASTSCAFSVLTCWLSMRGFEKVVAMLHRLPGPKPFRDSIITGTATAARRLWRLSLQQTSCRVEPESPVARRHAPPTTTSRSFPGDKYPLPLQHTPEPHTSMSEAGAARQSEAQHRKTCDRNTPIALGSECSTWNGDIQPSDSLLEYLCLEGAHLCQGEASILGTNRPTPSLLVSAVKNLPGCCDPSLGLESMQAAGEQVSASG